MCAPDQRKQPCQLGCEEGFNQVGNDLFIEWYWNYLKGRTVTIKHKGVEAFRACTRGVGQGCVISPVAYNLATEGALKLFPNDGAVPAAADPTDPFPEVQRRDTFCPQRSIQRHNLSFNRAV